MNAGMLRILMYYSSDLIYFSQIITYLSGNLS